MFVRLNLILVINAALSYPNSIYTSRTLEVLRFDSKFVIKVPLIRNMFFFSNMKILRALLQYRDNNVTEKLFSVCYSFEDLSILAYLSADGPTTNFIIFPSILKRLAFMVTIEDYFFTHIEHNVMIRALYVEYLHIADDILISYMVHELHSLNKVLLDILALESAQDDPNCALQLLISLIKTKFLTLSIGIISVSFLLLCFRLSNTYENSSGFILYIYIFFLLVFVRHLAGRTLS